MNFPKNCGIITNALRLLYQKFILKNGIKPAYLISLKKINRIECFYNKTSPCPLDVEHFCYELFTAIFLKKKFDYFINITGNYLIDKKIFTILILEICETANYLEIKDFNGGFIISGNFKTNKNINFLTKKLKGAAFKDISKNINYIKFNFSKTQKKSGDFETAYALLQNPLSLVNLYFQ